jgi:hypothetical protein
LFIGTSHSEQRGLSFCFFGAFFFSGLFAPLFPFFLSLCPIVSSVSDCDCWSIREDSRWVVLGLGVLLCWVVVEWDDAGVVWKIEERWLMKSAVEFGGDWTGRCSGIEGGDWTTWE